MSTFSADLKLELIGTGEASGTWGDDTNNNLNLIQQAIAGYEAVALSDGGTVTLVMTNKTISNARNMVIKFTGTLTGASIVTIPDTIEKFYIFDCSAVVGPTNLTIKTASGTGFTLDAAKIYAAYTDGTNLNEVSLDTLGGTIGSAQIADDAVTLAKMAPGTDGNIISYDASGNPVAVATGTSGQVLTSAGAGAPPTFADAGGSVSWQTGAIKTSTFTAVAGEGYFCNTAGGTFEVDLPAGSAGAIVSVQDYNNTFDSNSLTVDPNGTEKINGGVAGDPVTLDTEGQGVTFIYIDATVGWRSIQDNTFNQQGASASFIVATGGTITTVCTNYKVHTFTSPGTFTVCSVGNACGSNTVSYTVVAGGGGGAFDRGGGGGAGGFREGRTPQCASYTASPLNAPAGLPVSAQGYPITVGAGGSGGGPGPNSSQEGSTGSNTIFSSITSNGGGASGNGNGPERDGGNGGSGGGGGSGNSEGGAAGSGNTPPVSPAQGTNGGLASGSTCSDARIGGGGGGATVAGTEGNFPNGTPGNGNGGTGATTSINATPTARAGGGGGGKQGSPGQAGQGGTGGGANGGLNGNPGGTGSTNTGGGGGGGGADGGGGYNGGAGGSGIVIIRYKFQ